MASNEWAGNQWVASWGPNRLDIFGVGQDQVGIFHNRWDGSKWGSWEALGGAYFFSPPAVVSRDANRLNVFAVSLYGYEQSIITRGVGRLELAAPRCRRLSAIRW